VYKDLKNKSLLLRNTAVQERDQRHLWREQANNLMPQFW